MPLYEYQCEACGSRFEVLQKFSDPHPETCTKCGQGPVRRLQSSPAIQFKGTGWYITDYAQKGRPAGDGAASDGAGAKSEKKDGGEATSGAGGGETPATKSDTKTESKAAPPAAGTSSGSK